MKKILFLLLAATVLWSCQNNNYTIKGTVADSALEGANVYLQKSTDDGLVTVETTTIENGAFTFTGEADADVLRFVSLSETPQPGVQDRVPVLLERGTTTIVFGENISVKGTRLNTLFNDFRIQQSELIQKARELDAEMREERAKISAELQNLAYTFVKNNIGNELGKFVLRSSINSFDEEKQVELLALTDESFKAEPRIARLINRIENSKNVAVGKKFIDFTMQDPAGNEVSLSDFVGKGNYVLVDFWAAWCPPCRAKMPHMVELYARYKGKGFEIVGVSLDGQFGDERDHAAWVAGIKEMNMTWPQMSDLKFWHSPVVELYAFNGIPHLILLDKDGTIIARNENLHGEALDKKLAELMP
jgi:thiol-disulfide isomerase/thioredoxin